MKNIDPPVSKMNKLENKIKQKQKNILEVEEAKFGKDASESFQKYSQEVQQPRKRRQPQENPTFYDYKEAPKTVEDILSSDYDPESNLTIGLYFLNLLSFILVMLVYYGLVIILMITMCIHLYDYNYNYEEWASMFKVSDPSLNTHEFQSADQLDYHKDEVRNFHLGHKHLQLPFDFSNV